MQFDDSGVVLLLPGHPDHGAPAIDGLPDRITFEKTPGRDDPGLRRWVGWRGTERLPSVPDIG
jgi:hypothetical protein